MPRYFLSCSAWTPTASSTAAGLSICNLTAAANAFQLQVFLPAAPTGVRSQRVASPAQTDRPLLQAEAGGAGRLCRGGGQELRVDARVAEGCSEPVEILS